MQMDEEARKRRRGKNVAVLVVLLALVALIYAITLAKLGGS